MMGPLAEERLAPRTHAALKFASIPGVYIPVTLLSTLYHLQHLGAVLLYPHIAQCAPHLIRLSAAPSRFLHSMYTHLSVDTAYNARPGPSSDGSRRYQRSVSPAVRPTYPRGRSISNASSTSYQSMISPTSSSTNGSTTSLAIPTASGHQSRSRSASPVIDETVRLGPEYVLAMHDFVPQQQASTCLAFRAGQVIHVFNRDSSGWWDGELDGRRGWFPSNYVNATPGLQDGIVSAY